MADQSESSHLQVLFDKALQDYQKKTDIVLADHPLAKKLENCDSVDSVTDVLREQTQAFNKFWENDKVLKPLKSILSVLHTLFAAADFDGSIGKHFPPVKAIHTGLGVLLTAVKGAIDSYDLLVQLLESFEGFLRRLDIYSKITPTVAMNVTIVKILVELLSALALVTRQIKQGKIKKVFKKLRGEKDIEAVYQRLDQLTKEEALTTGAESLKILSDRVHKDILEWLPPFEPSTKHGIASESRYPGSADWFIRGTTFSEWKASEDPSSCLWIHGKPGAGKPVFCSRIIEEVDRMRKEGCASLAFFYCDFREQEQKTGLRGLLLSLLAQLQQSERYRDTLSNFYSEHAKVSRRPSDDELLTGLKKLLDLPRQPPVYIIVDALDECSNSSSDGSRPYRAKVLALLKNLIESQIPNLRICVTSRPEEDIKAILNPLIPRFISQFSLHEQTEQKSDIEKYIKSIISDSTHEDFGRWNEVEKKLAIDVLTKKADTTFRWVNCQVDSIRKCRTEADVKNTLADLPQTLEATYQRILREIAKPQQEYAHRLFQFVAVSSRPLLVEELADLLAFEDGPIPKFHEDWRRQDPVHEVLSTCSSLFTVVDGGSLSLPKTTDGGSDFEDGADEVLFFDGADDGYRFGKVIQFSHYSVKEFLTSGRLVQESDIILRRYHVSIPSAHTFAAQACLGILLHIDGDVATADSVKKWPLLRYAAGHWAYHCRFQDVSRNVEDGMKQLFDPRRPHFANCFRICNPDDDSLFQGTEEAKSPLILGGSYLQYAAFWGFDSIVEFLIIERSQDVNSGRGRFNESRDNMTPLHLASMRGHMKAACVLIERGADLTVRAGKKGSTPLHMALSWEHVEVACKLIEHGADMEVQDRRGWTPLDLVLRDQVEVACILLEHGADAIAQKYGETPLHLALRRGEVEVARMLIERGTDPKAQNKDMQSPLHLALQRDEVEVASMLIERGADVSAQNKHRQTPLYLAIKRGHVEVARMLIEHGADVLAKNKDCDTLLHLALQQNQVDVACMLIEHGADVSAQNEDGRTPLYLALSRNQVQVAHKLIEHSTDVSAQDCAGETPLHLASRWGYDDVARVLIERGADMTIQNENGQSPLHLALQWDQVELARMLIERGADVSAPNNYRETPLHQASSLGQVDVARMLIEQGADVSAQNYDGKTPLHLASELGQDEVARVLIERGAVLTAQNKDGNSPLHMAMQRDQVKVARMLIEHGADVSAQNKVYETPLHQALHWGSIQVACTLIEHGTNVKAPNIHRDTPLHLASRWGQAEVASMLIERGADVSVQNYDDEAPLHLASQWGQDEVARMLIDRGADLTAKNKDSQSPLHLALQRDQVEVACILIERGADLSVQNKNGQTPLHLALQWGQVKVARMLIERGADLTAQSKDGQSPLHLALRRDQVEVACILIERGADVSAQNKDGQTPLHLALRWGQVKVALMLIEHGADVLAQNEVYETPLHHALRWGSTQVACTLVERGADVTAPNLHRDTPLHLASMYGKVEVARMLIEHGADVTVQNRDGDTPLHYVSTRRTSETWQSEYPSIAGILLQHGADVNAQNKAGSTPFLLASQGGLTEVTRILLEHGADTGKMPASESGTLATSSAHSLSKLPISTDSDLPIPIPDPGEIPVSVTSPARTLADLPTQSHPLLTTPDVADTDLPRNPSLSFQPPSDESRDDILRPERIVAIVVAIPFLSKVSRRR